MGCSQKSFYRHHYPGALARDGSFTPGQLSVGLVAGLWSQHLLHCLRGRVENPREDGCRWLTPVILAIWKTESGRTVVQEIVPETPSPK
jgi:hypothetical protein